MIGTRTALQVKNRARHVVEYENESALSKVLRGMRVSNSEGLLVVLSTHIMRVHE